MTLNSNQFIQMLADRRQTLEDLAHEAPPIYGDIFKWLEKESELKDGRIESEVLMCCDSLMDEVKAREIVKTLLGNVSAFEVHKNRWFQLRIATENLMSEGNPVDNIRRNKFILILRSEP